MFLDVSTKEAPIKTQNALTVTSSSLPDMPHPTKDAELQQAQKPSMHRLDIQGLRGIAVLAVVAYHAHLPLPGGFVGVDMFFVISGWVVSSMVIRQVATKSFSLIDFYSRRIRRLIPMLSITNLATLALVAIFLSPFGEIQQAAATARWSTFFSANIQLSQADTYMNLIGNPFRHLWSLAVEEQFYLMFPIFCAAAIYLCSQIKRFRFEVVLRWCFLFVMIASSIYCASLVSSGLGASSGRFAFFSMLSRMWEFSCGIILATYGNTILRINKHVGLFLGMIGSLCLIGSFIMITPLTVYPGMATLLPVLGTIFLLISGKINAVVGNSLGCRPLVFLGDISYGWYLWHWPLMVVAEIVFPNSGLFLILAALLSLLIARIGLNFLENPIRRSHSWNLKRTSLLLLLPSVLILGASTFLEFGARSGFGLSANFQQDQSDFNSTLLGTLSPCSITDKADAVTFMQLSTEDFTKACSNDAALIASHGVDVLLVGDSQADSYSDGIFLAGRELQFSVAGYTAIGCAFMVRTPLRVREYCDDMNKHLLKIINESGPKIVVVTNRYDVLSINLDENKNRVPTSDNRIPLSVSEQIDSITSSLADQVKLITPMVDQIVVVTDLSNPSYPPRTLFETTRFARVAGNDPFKEISNLRKEINDSIDKKLNVYENVTVVDFSDKFCDSKGFCASSESDRLLFHDEIHLTATGSNKLQNSWIEIFKPLKNN